MAGKYLYDWEDQIDKWYLSSLNSTGEINMAIWMITFEQEQFALWRFIGQGLYDERGSYLSLEEAKGRGRELAKEESYMLITSKLKSFK